MSKVLYIIGNGFDLHHKLRTSYFDYNHYLKEFHSDVLSEIGRSKFFNSSYCSEAEENDKKEKGNFWSCLEQSLLFDYEEYFEDVIFVYAPNFADKHPNFGRMIFQVDDDKIPFSKFTDDYLIEWIKSIDVGKCQKDQILNLSKKDFYLSFNYTNTLQVVYNIPDANILHLHGSLKEHLASETPLQFGNPEDSAEQIQQRLENKYADHPCGSWVTDAIPAVVDLCRALTKNLKQNYESLKNFIQNKNFDEVIVMGHSFLGADKPYYDDILIPSLEKCKWTFYVYDDNDKKNVLKFKQMHPTICVSEKNW